MHYWGDKWFEEHGDNLYSAIAAVEKRIRKWARMGVCGKEKWGCYRDEYLTFWDGGLAQIMCGYRVWYGQNWWQRLWFKVDNNILPIKRVTLESTGKVIWLCAGLADFNRFIGLTKLINKWQARQLNKAFQVTCKEYPDVIDELVSDTDCYVLIKPCRWGNVDGTAIHNKYWTRLTSCEEFQDDIMKFKPKSK